VQRRLRAIPTGRTLSARSLSLLAAYAPNPRIAGTSAGSLGRAQTERLPGVPPTPGVRVPKRPRRPSPAHFLARARERGAADVAYF